MEPPPEPKIYHIVHIDRLPSILAMGELVSDTAAVRRNLPGTSIGDSEIKARRRQKRLRIYPDLVVGDCVPFYFCPRSVLLHSNYTGTRTTIENRDGQEPIVHLQSDLGATVAWAGQQGRRWLFTNANAALSDIEEFNDLQYLNRLKWDVISARWWKGKADQKMAEFLIEVGFPWHLVQRVGVMNSSVKQRVEELLVDREQSPNVSVMRGWYYWPNGG